MTEKIIKALDAAYRLTGTSCLVIDFGTNKVVYDNNLFFLKYATKENKRQDAIDPYWALMADETLQAVTAMVEDFWEYCKELPPEELSGVSLIADVPIMLGKHKVFINQRFTPLLLREDGSVRLGLIVISHSIQKKMLAQIVTSKKKRLMYDFKRRRFYEEEKPISLSEMERIILLLAKKGLISTIIAELMFKSVNTIKTHRQRIFQKLGVHSMEEAFTYIENYML